MGGDDHAQLRALSQSYDDYIDAFGLRKALTRELSMEDDYQQHVQVVLQNAHAEGLAGAYAGPDAFCGGGAAAQMFLRSSSQAMAEALRQLSERDVQLLKLDGMGRLIAQPMFCGLVPQGDLGVETRTGQGERGLVLFDVALWFFIRLGAQAVTAQLGAATGDSSWGPDADYELMTNFRDRLDGYVRLGETLRKDTQLNVIVGARERMRRSLNAACVIWILGHEYTHLIAPVLVPPPPPPPRWSEATELWSSEREWVADRLADSLVRTAKFSIDPIAAAIAPVLVHTLQAFVLRSNHAAGRSAPYWTHDLPEIRAGVAVEALRRLAEQNNPTVNRHYQIATHFREWLWGQMGTEAMFRDDPPEGIEPLSNTNAESRQTGRKKSPN